MKKYHSIFIALGLVHLSYGLTSNQAERFTEFKNLTLSDPLNAQNHFAYAQFLTELDNRTYDAEALKQFQEALTLQPRNFQWLFSYATFCCRIGKIVQALDAYKTILQHNPNLLQMLYNAGFTFKAAGNASMARAIYQAILTKQPSYPPAHLGLAFALLSLGEYKKGWHEHIWNLKQQKKYAPELHQWIQQGTVSGKTILLTPEGGLGDTLNFIRYAQRLKLLGARVIVAVQKPLVPLLSHCDYIDILCTLQDKIPFHDARCSLMTLPALFADDENSIPQNIPYLFSHPERAAFWHSYFQNNQTFKIGICWQPDVHNDVSRLPIARRGVPLSFFYTLGSTPGISLYSLQRGEGFEQLQNAPKTVSIHAFDEQFDVAHGSFMDSAAVIQEMDLIISADSAIAHLAGAMGKPVWLLLPFNVDWRWLLDRKDSPWYPTMRIFKQQRPFDWDEVIHQVHTIFFSEVFLK